MKGRWKLRLRMIFTSVLMFTIVYFLISLAGWYLGISSWYFYMGISLLITFAQYWYGPSLVKRSMNVRPLSEAEAPYIHQMVQELSDAAGVPKPEIGLSEINIPMHLHTEELAEADTLQSHVPYLDCSTVTS